MNSYELLSSMCYTVSSSFSYGTLATQVTADIGTATETVLSGYAPLVHIHLSGNFDDYDGPFVINWFDSVKGYELKDKISTSYTSFSGSHDFTLPGTYEIGFSDYATMTALTSSPALTARVYVEELPPTLGAIEITGANALTSPYTISTVFTAITAGSFPIEKVEFDFGDDTDIERLSVYSSTKPLTSSVEHTYYDIGDYTVNANVYVANTNSMFSQSAVVSVTALEPFSAFSPDGLTLSDIRLIEDGNGLVYVLSDNTSKTLYNMYLPIYRYDIFNFEDTLIYYTFPADTTITFNINKLTTDPIKLEWGDDTDDLILWNTGSLSIKHYFQDAIDGFIRIKCNKVGSFTFGRVDGITEYNIINNEHPDSILQIVLSDAVDTISKFSFAGLRNLTSVSVGSDTTSIAERAFYYCPSLESIIIPNSTRYIKDMAFYGCKELKQATVLGNAVDFGYLVFNGCETMVYFEVPYGTTALPYGMFAGAIRLNTLTIPNTVTSIGYGAFSDCRVLNNLTISENIADIGRGAFYNCIGMTDLTFQTVSPAFTVGDEIFFNCTNLKRIHVPIGEISNYTTILGAHLPVGCSIVAP